jgi:hypothetical protein
VDLATLANLAEVIGAIVVVGGLGFGMIQLQQYRLQRRARSAIEVARSLQDAEFARALRLVLSLPCGLDAKGLRERGTDYEDAAMLVSLTVEAVGLMVQRRLVSLPMVWELMGGVLLGAWVRLRGWTADVRTEQGRDKFNEWMQWLAEQMERYQASGAPEPAFQRYADWQPRSRDDRVN